MTPVASDRNRSSESIRVTPGRMDAFLKAAEAAGIELHALIVHQQGQRLFENYWWPHTPESLHATHSATKSFTGLAVGLAIDEGELALDDQVLDFFPEFAPISDATNLRSMTVRDLLTMRTGHDVTPSGAEWRLLTTSWVEAFLAAPVGRPPGEEFSYSSATAHMISAVVQRAVGEPISEYLRPRLFEPLGIDHYVWDLDPEGIASGGNGLSITASDFLKWGILHLNGGRWNGVQIVPASWVGESTKTQVGTIFNPVFDGRVYRPGTEQDQFRIGYGYQIWCGPQDSYYALGLFGQICLVVPDRELVVVLNAATDTKRLLPMIYRVLLADPTGDDAGLTFDSLRARRSADQQPAALSTVAGKVSAAVYELDENAEGLHTIGVRQDAEELHITFIDARGEHQVVAEVGSWRTGRTSMTTSVLHHSYQDEAPLIEAGARWKDARTLVLEIIFVETSFHETVTLRFVNDDEVRFAHAVNVNTGPTELPEVVGRVRR